MFSVGSLGENGAYEIVEQVYVKNCTFIRTENGMRIKTWPVQIPTLLNLISFNMFIDLHKKIV